MDDISSHILHFTWEIHDRDGMYKGWIWDLINLHQHCVVRRESKRWYGWFCRWCGCDCSYSLPEVISQFSFWKMNEVDCDFMCGCHGYIGGLRRRIDDIVDGGEGGEWAGEWEEENEDSLCDLPFIHKCRWQNRVLEEEILIDGWLSFNNEEWGNFSHD